jgi:multiple sugar transport system substrate-binding protein
MTKLTRRRAIAAGLAGSAVAAAGARAQAPRTIELWSFLDPAGKGSRSEVLAHILKTFADTNPGVTVKTNIMQWTEISPTLLRAARAGNVPDVVMLYSPYMATHVNAGTLQPIDEFVAKWPKEKRDDIVTMTNARDRQGKLHGLPWEMRLFGYAYRQDLVEKAGGGQPKTMDELVAVAAKVQQGGVQGLGTSFNPATSTTGIEWILPGMISLGGKVVDDKGRAAFSGPAGERMMRLCHDLVHKHRILNQDTALMQTDDIQALAIAGQVAFFSQGTHRLGTMQERSQGGAKWSFMPFPAIDPAKPIPGSLQGWHLVIPKKSKNVATAWKLVDYWTGFDMQLHQSVNAGYLPSRRSVAADPRFDTALNKQFRLAAALEYVARHPLRFNWPESTDALNDTIDKMIQQVITNRMPPAEALAWGEKTYNTLKS